MRLAQIENGVVVNVIEVDPQDVPEWAADWPEAGNAGPGSAYDGQTFTAPVEVSTATAEDVRAEAARRLSLLASPYSREERETWHIQVAEAEAFAADVQADVPMLAAIAAPRNITVAQMASLVLKLRDSFRSATAKILAAQASLMSRDPIPTDYQNDQYWK